MRGWGLETSWLAKSAPIHAGMAITHYIHRPIPSGVLVMGVAPSPRYFQYEKKLCKKHFAQVLEQAYLPQVHLGRTFFTNYWVGHEFPGWEDTKIKQENYRPTRI